MNQHILFKLAGRYPQLALPIASSTKESISYRKAVLQGQSLEALGLTPEFSFHPADTLTEYHTPVGDIEVLHIHDRADFEHCIQALAYRCENRVVPSSMGATTVSGLINWEKIRTHRLQYILQGHSDWSDEFKRFTAKKENYQDHLIILSSGYYSFVSPEQMDLDVNDWLTYSQRIRTYHELTHYISRMKYPNNIQIIRDEVIADMIGLIAAFGYYDTNHAKLMLGITEKNITPNGRLRNYIIDGMSLEDATLEANTWIQRLTTLQTDNAQDMFEIAEQVLHQIL